MLRVQRWSGLSLLRRCTADLPEALQIAIQDRSACAGGYRGIKTQANEVRAGNVLQLADRLLEVVKAAHAVGHGRQLGNVQMELRDLKTKRKQKLRLRPYDAVELVRLEARAFQYLYAEEDQLHLMDPERFDQVSMDRSLFGEQSRWLCDGMEVTLSLLQDGVPVSDGGAFVKGDTAGSALKPCTLENGVQLNVPPYVETGQRVVVDTRDGSFVKRLL